MTTFVMNELMLNYDEAYKIQKIYFKKYGTTMRGLMENHKIEPTYFLDYVHKIDLSPIKKNDKLLEKGLKNLPGRKIIFTNGSKKHALNVMRHLGVSHHFDKVFDILDSNYIPKPDKAVYTKMIKKFEINPKSSAMIEDMAQNLIPAHELGMKTVWLRSKLDWAMESSENGHIDYIIEDLIEWFNDIQGM